MVLQHKLAICSVLSLKSTNAPNLSFFYHNQNRNAKMERSISVERQMRITFLHTWSVGNMLSYKSFLHLPIFFLTNYLNFYQNVNKPGLQRDWWRPCIQRSRSMIPQQTRNVGKILNSESLPLWFAVDFRLPRIWKLRKFVENLMNKFNK